MATGSARAGCRCGPRRMTTSAIPRFTATLAQRRHGVASVAVVQVLIWGALCVVGALAVAQMMPPEMMEGVQAMQQGVPGAAAAIDVNPEMLQVIAAITDFGFILRIFAYLLLFVFGGYLFYSAMFAAVGSAVDS